MRWAAAARLQWHPTVSLHVLKSHTVGEHCPLLGFPFLFACPLPPDFNMSKILEGARPDSSLSTAGVTNPLWLVRF